MTSPNKSIPWLVGAIVFIGIVIKVLTSNGISLGSTQGRFFLRLAGFAVLPIVYGAVKAFSYIRQHIQRRASRRAAILKAYRPLTAGLFAQPCIRRSLNRGICLYDAEKNLQAFNAFKAILKRDLNERERAVVLYLWGCCVQGDGQGAAAVQWFELAARIWPGLQPAWTRLAGLYRAAGEQQRSEQAYRYAIRLRPDDPTAFLRYAIGLNQWRRPDEAIQVLHQAREQGADEGSIQISMAVAYALKGDGERSREHMEMGEKLMGREEADKARAFLRSVQEGPQQPAQTEDAS